MTRLPAQWETQEAILVAFPHMQSDWNKYLEAIEKAYCKFIETIALFQKCIVLSSDIQKTKTLLQNDANISYIYGKTNDTWIRDFGAIDFFHNEKLESYDFTFNAWGDKFSASLDNNINKILFKNTLKGTLHVKDFVLEGGSIDSNGSGTLLTTAKCIFNKNRNPNLNGEEIKNSLIEFFGLTELIILKNGAILGDDTDSHIDTLARFIDKKTIAYVTCKDENDPHFLPLKKMEKELKKTNFALLPLPLPAPKFYENRRLPATYANFIFVNGGLIVPTYQDKNDTIALKTLQSALPHLKVVGVDATIFIRENGSLHCASINRFKGKR